MNRFLKDLTLFFLLLIAVSSAFSSILDSTFRTKTFSHRKHTWVLSLKDRRYDYAVIGSSRVLNMIDITLMDSILGKHGINLATSGSSYGDNYTLLLLFLQNNNRIKDLFLNVDEFCFDSEHHYSYPFNDYEYLPFLYQPGIRTVFKDWSSHSKLALWTYIPFSRYSEFSDKYKLSDLYILKSTNSKYEATKGSELLPDTSYKKFNISQSTISSNPKDISYFFKIVSVARSQNIRLHFITTPEFVDIKNFQTNREAIYHTIGKWSDSLQIPYYPFESVGDFSGKRYFRDYTHMNALGSDLYSKLLAEKLKTDHAL